MHKLMHVTHTTVVVLQIGLGLRPLFKGLGLVLVLDWVGSGFFNQDQLRLSQHYNDT